ncbi:hypothetical protein L249_7253 [Ophiocordyceps polyrhachis-furcata BCC 54312]|uniref:Pheromone a factor receptor n=1 Tax=Ophiocordyceps polyrhachis-furcata BCC 54312 TaxID=1330021 RepID=A0A367LAW3_9HYPO|nr:hypothetical protein L249_7253 [Ophiocordyceps polyrhachis-furcata BCC 54312]
MDSGSTPPILFLDGNQTAVVGWPPYTQASLTHNLVLRVTLSLVANAVCLVPLRVLYRNGEFAAAAFIVTVELLNLEAVINSLGWRNDDFMSWWSGHGLCDIVVHVHNAITAGFISCMLAIMRNLAQQVSLKRAAPLESSERRRRNLIQALIIFPLPLLQLALTVPIAARRYTVGTLVGCVWAPHPSWPLLTFFVFPPVILSVLTVGYAALAYHRFRQIAKMTEAALSNSLRASRRSNRTRRRLYLMVMSILLPYLPLVVAVAVANVLEKPPNEPFNFDAVHNHAQPPWSVVLFFPSSEISWINLNNCYISVIVAVPIFLSFGTTKEAVNEYRVALLCVGLGYIIPSLRREYDPDRIPLSDTSMGSSQPATTITSSSTSPFAKIGSSLSSCRLTLFGSVSTSRDPPNPERNSDPFTTASWTQEEEVGIDPLPALQDIHARDPARLRNPFFFRTRLNNFSLSPRPAADTPDFALYTVPAADHKAQWEHTGVNRSVDNMEKPT